MAAVNAARARPRRRLRHRPRLRDRARGAGWHVLAGDMAEIEPGGVVPDRPSFDVRDPEAVEAGLAEARRAGPFDALVYAAGIARVTPLIEISPQGLGPR